MPQGPSDNSGVIKAIIKPPDIKGNRKGDAVTSDDVTCAFAYDDVTGQMWINTDVDLTKPVVLESPGSSPRKPALSPRSLDTWNGQFGATDGLPCPMSLHGIHE